MKSIAINALTYTLFACTLIVAISWQCLHAQPVASFDIDQFLAEIRSSKAADRIAAIDRLGVASGIHSRSMFVVGPGTGSLTREQLDRLLIEVAGRLSDADAEVRQRAIAVLNGHGAHDDAKRVLVIKLLDKDPDEMVRVRAAMYCSRLGWPAAVIPLLGAIDDPSPQASSRAIRGLHGLGRSEFVLDDEIALSKTLLRHLGGPASNARYQSSARYQSARLLLAAMPDWYSRVTGKPEVKQVLSVWKKHQAELQRCMEGADAKTGVFIAAALLRMDAKHQRAIDYLRREIATVKSEYQNNGFGLGESFPLLGDDAKQLVPAAIAHATYPGSWAVPGFYGRQHLRQLGSVAVPFIVKELANAESPDADKALPRGDTLGFLSLLYLMGKDAEIDGNDVTAALPAVERLTKSADEATQKAAFSALDAIK